MTPLDRATVPTRGRWLGVSARRRARQVLLLAGLAYAGVAALVLVGALDGLDALLVAGVRSSQRWVDDVGLWVELPGLRSFVYPAVLVYVLVLSLRARDLRPLLAAALSFFLVNVLVGTVKMATGRATPRIGGPETFADRMAGLVGAFPSGHAANIAAVVVLLALVARRYASRRAACAAAWLGSVTVAAVSVTSWLRDTHWTSDLVAGVAAGAFAAAAGALLVDRLGTLWPRTGRVPRPVWWGAASTTLLVLVAGWVMDTSWSPDHLGWLGLGATTGLVAWFLTGFRQERRSVREARAEVDTLDGDGLVSPARA
jgi:membrane-associated phospholipid phosphatase